MARSPEWRRSSNIWVRMNRSTFECAASGVISTRRCSQTIRDRATRSGRRSALGTGRAPTRSSATAWRTAAGDRPTSRAASSTDRES
jgi:hypothetical protein